MSASVRFRILLFTFLISLASWAQGKVIEKIVAVVGDQIILLSDLEDYEYKLKHEGLVQDLLFTIRSKKDLSHDQKALTQHLIDEKMIDLEIKRQGVTATFERIEQEIRSVLAKNRLTRNQLKEALAARGVLFSDYQDFIKASIERQMLVEKVINSKIRISDDDVATAYISKKSKSMENQVFEFSLAHILFDPGHGGDAPA